MLTYEVIESLENWLIMADPSVSPSAELSQEEHNLFVNFRSKNIGRYRTFKDLVLAYIKYLRKVVA